MSAWLGFAGVVVLLAGMVLESARQRLQRAMAVRRLLKISPDEATQTE